MAIDFHYYYLQIKNGIEVNEIPGGIVVAASRGAHRHRRGDLLALLFTFSDNSILSDDEFMAQPQELTALFFRSPGSVTRAIQLVAEELGRALWDHNSQVAESGKQVTAVLNIAVLHREHLFVGHSGATHTFVIKSGSVEQYSDMEPFERPLGLSRRVMVQYRQAPINAGDIIIICPQPPITWTCANLSGSPQIGMEQVKRRLLNQVRDDMRAVIIKCREGEGKTVAEVWSADQSITAQVAEQSIKEVVPPEQESHELEAGAVSVQEGNRDFNELTGGQSEVGLNVASTTNLSTEIVAEQQQEQLESQEVPVKPGQTEFVKPRDSSQIEDQIIPAPNSLLVFVAKAWQAWNGLRYKFAEIMKKISRRIFPRSSSGGEKISPVIMVFMVIALPAVLIAVSLTIYIRSGKQEQHDIYLTRAQEYAALATEHEDLDKQREYWSQAYELVSQALEYGQSSDSDMLFLQSQSILDEMDLVTRLEFRPALTGLLPEGVEISKIITSTSGVYLLDSSSGAVLRLFLNTKGFYEIDPGFQCGPGDFGLSNINPIVDLIALPANTRNYKIMAADSDGNLLYCLPGEEPTPTSLIPPDDVWGRIATIAMDKYTMFIVDAEKDAVWFYEGRDFENEKMAGVVFGGQPESYLEEDVPDLGGTLEMAVNEDDLFVLHQDSHMTLCQFNPYRETKRTECQDPAPYSDSRVSYDKKPLVYMDACFVGMQDMRYPNASLYILDAANNAVMQFSYQLNMERVLKPQPSRNYPIPDSSPTGFGISVDKEIFLAYGNQILIAALP
ncbi:MAG TPA: hypothetical protein G4N92_07185 [Anaerolineae bacterium]|nr:hypothetical protein [Anaerolineae bacterium]